MYIAICPSCQCLGLGALNGAFWIFILKPCKTLWSASIYVIFNWHYTRLKECIPGTGVLRFSR